METIFNDIAREIKGNTSRAVNKAVSTLGLDFGTITSTGLKVDNFKCEIKDYMILDFLLNNPLIPGDRVLVATVTGNFVVIGRVTNA